MMCVGMFMAILDVQVVATSLPTIQKSLGFAQEQISWVQTAYLIAEIVSIPLTGFFTRLLTVRWLFVISVSAFTVASIGCALSGGFATLILWRAIQGFSGGVLIPVVFSAVFLFFSMQTQTIATTIAGVLAVLAPTVGPVVGGWITDTFSWPALFLINVIPGIVAAFVASWSLPRERPNWELVGHLDYISLLLLASSLTALEIAIKEAPDRGWTTPLVSGLLVFTFFGSFAFCVRVLRARRPLVDLRIFTERNFSVGCLLSFVLGMGLFGSVYLMPLFSGFVSGHDAFAIGKIMLVTGLAQLLIAPMAVMLEARLDERILSSFGFLLFGVGLMLSCDQGRLSDYDQMFWPQVVRGTATMFCILAPTRLALAQFDEVRIPDASAVFNMMRNLGGAIGIAMIDTIIYTRAPLHVQKLTERIAAGDSDTINRLDLPPALSGTSALSSGAMAPLLKTVAFVEAINDAWLLLALAVIVAIASIVFARAPVWSWIVSIRNGRIICRYKRA
jgi:DHA2 family multidrug resistance protein